MAETNTAAVDVVKETDEQVPQDTKANELVVEDTSKELPSVSISLEASEGVVATNIKNTVTPTGATATFQVELPEGASADDLDYTDAQLAMTAGDGYYVDEFVDPVVQLAASSWHDEVYTYSFDDEQLQALFTRAKVRGSESDIYSEGGPDWTAFGGNGNGQYYFNLTVRGIKYQGVTLDDATFRVCYYAYGRDASDKARITLAEYRDVYDYETNGAEKRTLEEQGGVLEADQDVTWTWIGDTAEGKPILCDTKQDDFYIIWPEGVDASQISAEAVSIVLYSQYGDAVSLEKNKDYFVYAGVNETQIAVPYVNMAFTPVYNKMSISIDEAAVADFNLDASLLTQEYEVASVYIYQVQHGGLNPNGAVLVYQFYGFDEDSLTDWSQLMHPFGYALYVETANGDKKYYSEVDGGSYVNSVEDATVYDATGKEDLNIRLWNEAVIYDTTCAVENADGTKTYRTETKTINGEDVVFNKEICEGWDGNDLRGVQVTPTEAKTNGLKAAEGYAFPKTDDFYETFAAYNFGHDYWVAHSMWPWVEGIEVGWLTGPEAPQAGWNGFEKGYNYQYDGDGNYPNWTAADAKDNAEWWPWLRSGFPEEMWQAVDQSNADRFSR